MVTAAGATWNFPPCVDPFAYARSPLEFRVSAALALAFSRQRFLSGGEAALPTSGKNRYFCLTKRSFCESLRDETQG